MNRLKVAHITTVDTSLRYLLLNQMRSLQEEGYDVVGISSPGPDVPFLEEAGIRHIPVTMTRNMTPFADLRSLMELYRVLRRERFTIVHTHTPKPGLLGQLAARLAGVPLVINTLHGFYFHDHTPAMARRFYITMEKIAARCSDRILSQNCEDIQTALRERICSADRIEHLGNGIDLTLFDPDTIDAEARHRRRQELGIPTDVRIVGFVGRLAARRKGFLDFLRAGAAVAQQLPEVRFLIVGDADRGKPDAVEPETARDYGIWERCHFLGLRQNHELPGLYSLMDVLVLPSIFEGIPRVIMEASAMQVPAVATDVKGNREAVQAGRNGLLVPLGDVAALTAAIVELLTNRERAVRMGEEGRRLALERFDERLVFTKVKAVYAELLATKGLLSPSIGCKSMNSPL